MKRTINGLSDPHLHRRHKKSHKRSTNLPFNARDVAHIKDTPETSRALDKIRQAAIEKEYSTKASIGPHSTPTERHYEKSFFLKPKKDEQE